MVLEVMLPETIVSPFEASGTRSRARSIVRRFIGSPLAAGTASAQQRDVLRPLVLRDVANDIGMHESTVSRVVNNKYMHTPQGVYEMKFFFHSGISSSYGESVSSVTIKQRIRKIIEAEDAKRPLSDSKIVSILQKEGLMLARRTIAKYREELKIPTSNQRKVLY